MYAVTKHPFHLVRPSPYPLLTSLSLLLLFSAYVFWFRFQFSLPIVFCLFILLFVLVPWFANIIRESTLLGLHTTRVQSGLRLGMALFIISELFFFLSFFWAYLHFALSPAIELGSIWPPAGIRPLTFSTFPLLNTCLLLVSGATLTHSHASLLGGFLSSSYCWLTYTLILGLLFLGVQGYEYYVSPFSIADSSFGSSFFLATGFHGLHVLVGTLLLFVSLSRLFFGHFTPNRHFGLEASIWYWHFVDVIWLLLFLIFYVWGSH